MIAVLAVVAALGGLLVFLLATVSADTAFLSGHTLLLIGATALAALVLLVLVALQLKKLWGEYRDGLFGARLKLRLLLMLALMAVAPGALVYAVSLQFAIKSIDSWFNVRVEAALDGGLDLGRGVFDAMQSDLLAKGRTMAFDLAEAHAPGAVLLNRLREQTGVRSASLISASGQLLANSSGDLQGLLPKLPEATQLRQARLGTGLGRIEGDAEKGFVVRALIPVTSYRLGTETQVLVLEQPVPSSITRNASAVEAAQREYQELQLGRTGLRLMYSLTLTFALLVALFAAVALAFFLAARLARPLLMVVEGTRAVAAGDFAPRATLDTGDELGVLTQSFNDMTTQLEQARRDREAAHASMLAAQRAAAWGEVARRLAHEIKNPLTPIQLSAERLQMKLADRLDPEGAAILGRATRTIVDQVEAMKNMVNDFRDYARLPPPTLTPLDLNVLIAEVVDLYEGGAFTVSVTLAPALPPVSADADQVRQVLHNLIKNAGEAMGEKKAAVRIATRLDGDRALLSVSDAGPGFPAQILENAFEPYVTTKPKGTGLGLAIVRKIVDDHGGTIRLANLPASQGGGAEVSVHLPLHPTSTPGAATA